MVDLTADKRRAMPSSQFAGPGRSFPVNDPEHARLAIGGATRSEHAGNISPALAEKIKAAARAKLNVTHGAAAKSEMAGMEKQAARHRNLTKASAKHLHTAGHISKAHHDRIVKSASQPFGSLAPEEN